MDLRTDLPIPKGAIIRCPKCKVALMRTTRELDSGMTIKTDMFIGISFEPVMDEPAECNHCGTDFFTFYSFHWTLE